MDAQMMMNVNSIYSTVILLLSVKILTDLMTVFVERASPEMDLTVKYD